jgi:precorrin-6Y C5,15-methyltransferase (decarboxylating)
MSQTIKVIGIGDNGKESLLPFYQKLIEESRLLVGGERQLEFFPDYTGEKLIISGGLTALVERLQAEKKQTVVLASGDPLFYGIGGYLSTKLSSQARVEVYPQVSSIQLAFARMGESWQDAFLTSVHGRSMQGLAQRIDGRSKVAILTDETNNPSQIAKYLLSFGMKEYKAFVAENVGGNTERCSWYELEELTDQTFSSLNLVILKKTEPSPQWSMGIDDAAFAQRKPDKGLITKKEIRILSLAALQLRENSTVWDIGTCTGSMAIEAARVARFGSVYAIEKNEADLENCWQNQRTFRTDFIAIHGKAPTGLDSFPDPDAIFIGGTGGEMRELLAVCCQRLKEGGRIVLNAATIENLYLAKQAFKEEGFSTNITLAQISRSKPILDMTRFEGLNPIYIISAERQREEQ